MPLLSFIPACLPFIALFFSSNVISMREGKKRENQLNKLSSSGIITGGFFSVPLPFFYPMSSMIYLILIFFAH
jgi:hypothetical protein